jgi:hypothetical protein
LKLNFAHFTAHILTHLFKCRAFSIFPNNIRNNAQKEDQDEKIKFREEDYDDFIDDDILVNEEKEIEEQIKLKKLLAEAINLNTHGQLYFSNGKI